MNPLSFCQLPLSAIQLKNLEHLGYHEMTPIQAKALPIAICGKDLIAQAKTGSGKTVAFALPLLHRLDISAINTQSLVLCPTRELSAQVTAEIRRLACHQHNIKVVTLCGGQSIAPQISTMKRGAHIVVGTPGRIMDHLRRKTLSLGNINTLILDEADRMLEMGFIDDITQIIQQTAVDRQTLFFSATYPEDMLKLSEKFQRAAERVSVDTLHTTGKIDQKSYVCNPHEKPDVLLKLLSHFRPEATIVFCNTKQLVREVCHFLQTKQINTAALHGDMEQRDRDQVMIRFKQKSITVLVATDVAARGLDIDDLPAVINFDLPDKPDIYVHRIGRTGRADKQGLALSLMTHREIHKLNMICEYQSQPITEQTLEDMHPTECHLPPPRYVTLLISGGRKDKIRPGDILGALTGEAGIQGSSVGNISVTDFSSYVAIEQHLAKKALTELQQGRIKGRKFKVRGVS